MPQQNRGYRCMRKGQSHHRPSHRTVPLAHAIIAPMLVLVDGSSVLYRAYYAIRGLSTRAGVPTNAVYGFITILNKIIKDFHPDAVAVAFDVSKKTFRTELYPDYKAHRPPMPDDLATQIPKIKEYLDLAGIPRLEYPNYEADDVIATLAKTHSQHEDVLILSGDKDLISLITPRISLYQPSKEVRLTPEKVKETLEIEPAQMTDILALMGDASDNIPGVKGIGEKGAFKLVKEWGTLENIYAHLGAVKPDSLKNKLIAGKADALLSKSLIILKDDLPLETQMKPFSEGPPSPETERMVPLPRIPFAGPDRAQTDGPGDDYARDSRNSFPCSRRRMGSCCNAKAR